MKPLALDLYCGLGGWAEGFLAEGYRVVGFDIERHDYGTGGYPGELVLRDVRSIHGAELVQEYGIPAVIVGSSPCQEFSYRAMPWKRAKALPPPYLGIELFEAQFRIQREACEAAGRYIPLIVENVRGAGKWIGRAKWHCGSYYLWGDVPALMPIAVSAVKVSGLNWSGYGEPGYVAEGFNVTAVQRVTKNDGGSWFAIAHNTTSGHGQNPDGRKIPASCAARRWEDRPIKRLRDAGTKGTGGSWFSPENSPDTRGDWRESGCVTRCYNSKDVRRKAAAAQIAKIPFPLAQHIARCFKPVLAEQD